MQFRMYMYLWSVYIDNTFMYMYSSKLGIGIPYNRVFSSAVYFASFVSSDDIRKYIKHVRLTFSRTWSNISCM